MQTIKAIKLVTTTIVGIGTSKIVKTIIENNVEPDSTVDTITVTAGSYVIGGMVADASKTWTDAKIDQIVTGLQELKSTMDSTKK